MRKTRLVILPTKCLHQMGFLLLFLSCPVIGDWGRIRPESENSHNAIQIDREGTCGLERDPPGGLLDFLNDTGSKQCRLSENLDLNKPLEKPISIRRSDERRVDFRRINQRESERRMIERREFQRDVQRNLRSRSVESRRSNNRNDLRVRSLSLTRSQNERIERDRSTRRYSEGTSRRETERLHMTRQNERRVEQQRRLKRETSDERRENEIKRRNIAERRERETRRLTRSAERERQDIRRDNNRRSFQGLSTRRENQNRERTESIRERSERRLSLARRELQDDRREERIENRRNTNRVNLERRLPEIRKTRNLEFITREKPVRITPNSDKSQDGEERRIISLTTKVFERNARERRVGILNERMDGKTMRINVENKKTEKPFEEASEWMNFKNHEGFKTGDWTTNCFIGAIVYFFTTRQIKTV